SPLGMTRGRPASIIAAALFVVPRSMPRIFSVSGLLIRYQPHSFRIAHFPPIGSSLPLYYARTENPSFQQITCPDLLQHRSLLLVRDDSEGGFMILRIELRPCPRNSFYALLRQDVLNPFLNHAHSFQQDWILLCLPDFCNCQ